MTRLREIGTCEHIWTAWEIMPVSFGCLPGSIRVRHRRSCDLCYGWQYARDDGEKAEKEQAALTENLTGARR